MAALVWSVVLLRRLKDWRVGFLTALLTLMAASEGVLIFGQAAAWPIATLLRVAELPNLLVSVLALLAVAVSGRVIADYREVERALSVEKAHLEQLFEGAPLATVLVDNDSRILRVNAEFTRLFGYAKEEVVGQSLDHLLARGSLLEEARQITRDVASGQPVAHETIRYRKDGSPVWVAILGTPIRIGGGQVAVYGTYRDITERKAAQRALEASEARYALAARGANDGLWDWDLLEGQVYFSARWKAMLGYADHEIGSSPEDWLGRVHPEDRDQVRAALQAHLNGETEHFESEHRIQCKDASYRWVLSRGLAVRDGQGRPYRMAGSLTDISQRKAAEQKLLHEAIHDGLTGLPNRALFMDLLARSVARAKRHPDYLFAVLFLDLDRFKVINDGLGHLVGDQLLVGLARRLEQCLRPEDTVARLGGDEFTVLLEDIHDVNDATRVAERIHQALETPFQIADHEVFTSASIGIALSATGYDSPDQVLRDADTAMYRAKVLGKARHEVFDRGMHARAVTQLQLETDLRRALERGEFRLHYQPVFTVIGRRLVGFEALVRWQHPERGLLPPAEFVPVAEETGQMLAVGAWVLEQACRSARAWSDGSGRPLLVTVNLSNRQFGRADLADHIARVLRETGLPAERLKLEITESVILEQGEAAMDSLHRLRRLGVELYIDDFGTGYSSFGALHRLPITALKIDRSFVNALDTTGDGGEIVRTILSLARNLGLNVIAEGVETQAQLRRLRALRCPLAQGSWLSPPLAAEAVPELLAKERRR